MIGPLLVAVFTDVEFARYGSLVAAVAAYLAFAAAQGAVVSWNRYQLRHARRQLAALRSRRR